ncbi:MAG: hypothetical protein AVDCRST_MAG66-3921 [uncultured Pseudonocardia sp.]|uniref:DUF5667 domain-containing protein n=1 Tax=uncultured Pseudonocardia sp. TaxID=211455 RepID=A0A6J4QGS9_9PSEU|nr:MAG: hypothetical protein AVDCRST_MAG66-3921 [uncultured Pseudonocardia sp.]
MASSPLSRSAHRATKVAVGSAVATGLALAIALPALAAPTPPIVAVAPVGSAGTAANGVPELDDLVVPAQPGGCSDAQLRERSRQLDLLAGEQVAEIRVIATVADGSAPAKLGAIRDRAATILGRIADLDGRCSGDAGAEEESPVRAPAPDAGGGSGDDGGAADGGDGGGADGVGEDGAQDADGGGTEDGGAANDDRVLAALEIACADVDFGGADAAAVTRADRELTGNETQLDDRLATEFPRFARRVAREADPEAARAEFTRLAEGLAGTLEDRRRAILDRAGEGLADRFADTCEVVETR